MICMKRVVCSYCLPNTPKLISFTEEFSLSYWRLSNCKYMYIFTLIPLNFHTTKFHVRCEYIRKHMINTFLSTKLKQTDLLDATRYFLRQFKNSNTVLFGIFRYIGQYSKCFIVVMLFLVSKCKSKYNILNCDNFNKIFITQ